MKLAQYKPVSSLALYGLPIVGLLLQFPQPWVLPSYLGLTYLCAAPQPQYEHYRRLSFWTTASSWTVAALSVVGAMLGLFFGALTNQQTAGVLYGTLAGLVMSASGIGILWIAYWGFQQTSCSARELMTQQTAQLPITRIVLMTLAKAVGLTIVMLIGHRFAGMMGIAVAATWAWAISKFR